MRRGQEACLPSCLLAVRGSFCGGIPFAGLNITSYIPVDKDSPLPPGRSQEGALAAKSEAVCTWPVLD